MTLSGIAETGCCLDSSVRIPMVQTGQRCISKHDRECRLRDPMAGHSYEAYKIDIHIKDCLPCICSR